MMEVGTSRRALLAASALGLLPGCVQGSTVPAALLADVSNIAVKLGQVLQALRAVPGMPAAAFATAETYLGEVQAASLAIAAANAAPGPDKIAAFVNAVTALLGAVTPYLALLSPSFAAVATAVGVVLPAVEQMAGLPAMAGAANGRMSLSQAEAILGRPAI